MTPITSLQPFIDLELHTVPLNGKSISRDAKGKKHGFSMPSNWQKEYSENLSEMASPIGGLLTGQQGLICIDCDDEPTYRLFKGMDTGYTAYTDSIGKLDKDLQPIACGTIMYKYSDKAPSSFRGTGAYAIDYFNGTGMVFLPTLANSTKGTWLEDDEGILYNEHKQPIEFKEIPQRVIDLLNLINQQKAPEKTIANTKTNKQSKGFLAKVIENYDLNKGEYYPQLTQILTPKEYRGSLYKKQGHLHPNDIEGSGHMYLFKIACAIASDNTVDKVMAEDVIDYLNELWDEPIPSSKLEKTIKAPIFTGRQTNENGEAYWSYDENWAMVGGFTVITKRDGEILEAFYDSKKQQYFTYNKISDDIVSFLKKADLVNHLRGVSGKFDQGELDDYGLDIHTYSSPTHDYGFFNDDRDFNLFKASEPLRILNDPSLHETSYARPVEFIQYMEHFIPSEEQRDYFLRLLRTKMTTFKYSPVVPYIIGVQGSGKNTIMTVLQNIMGGSQYVKTDVGGEQFLERYNGWIMDTYFIQLNELGDTVTSASDKKKAQGLLKNYTGSEQFECRRMYSDPFTYQQTAMFILTANSSPLTLEETDRRLYYISTPNTFDFSPQCISSDPVTVYNAIMKQTNDICYWLATEFKNLQSQDYVRAPEAEGKMEMVFESQNSSSKIAWALANAQFDLLNEWLIEPMAIFSADAHANGQITLDNLAKAYAHHSTSEEPETVMKLAMKAIGVKAHFGSHNKQFYIIPHLKEYDGCMPETEEEAEDINLEPMRS